MNKDNIKENFIISTNNKTELKNQLNFLAKTVKNEINQNQNLTELITIKRNQIVKNKENLSKLSILKSTIKSKNELENKIIKEIESNNNEIVSLNNYLNEQIESLKSKYISLKNLLAKNNTSLINKLNIVKDRQFIYENVLEEKDSKIKILKYHLIDNYIQSYNIEKKIEIFHDEECFDSDEEISKNLNDSKDLLLKKSIGFNKYKRLKLASKKKIIKLKNQVKNINKYINTLQNLITNFDCIDFPNYNSKIYIEGEECIQEKNITNDNNDINNNIITITDDSENISNEECINEPEEELKIYNLITNPFIEEKTKIKDKILFPKLDLSLINYNKKKMKIDDKEKSLSRDNSYDKDILSIRINKLKNDIKLQKEKNEMLLEKIKYYKQKINEMHCRINKMSRPQSMSFKIKSVKRRNLNFNSTSVLYTNSLSRIAIKKFESSGIDNLNNIRSFYSNRYI